MVHGADKAIQAFGFFLQRFLVRLQGIQQVALGPVKDVFDVVQAEIQFSKEQDLLKPEHSLFVVIAIAILAIG